MIGINAPSQVESAPIYTIETSKELQKGVRSLILV